MEKDSQQAEPSARKPWPVFMGWVGNTTALIGLFASLAGGVAWFVNHHRQKEEYQAKIALAQAQAKQEEYQASLQTYAEILKADPLDRSALDLQLNTAMQWTEDFHAPDLEGKSPAEQAASALDEILPILDSGLSRAKGSQAADVQAHIGWAHWLNQHIAHREFGSAAEQNFRGALATDPSNVYANAMLGNWMLQKRASFTEAVQHLDIAVSTGKARPFVRELQLGGLIYLDQPGARAELIKAVDQMRTSNEPIDEGTKRRILAFCFDSAVRDHAELVESLSGVPPDESWKTYLWLDDNAEGSQFQATAHDFIHANVLELQGNRQEALDTYRLLARKLKNEPGPMKSSVDAAIARLSKN